MAAKVKGRLTFRITAVLFVISAVFELIAVTSGAPLFGAMRGGSVAIIYHLLYAGLFFGLCIGLWQAKPWGYKLVFITTIVYTLDKAQYLLDRKTMLVYLKTKTMLADLIHQLGGSQELWQSVLQAVTIMTLLIIAGWGGFSAYTYYRRDYFFSRPENQTAETAAEENNNGT